MGLASTVRHYEKNYPGLKVDSICTRKNAYCTEIKRQCSVGSNDLDIKSLPEKKRGYSYLLSLIFNKDHWGHNCDQEDYFSKKLYKANPLPLSHVHQNWVEPRLMHSRGPLNPGSTRASKVGSTLLTRVTRCESGLQGVKVCYKV